MQSLSVGSVLPMMHLATFYKILINRLGFQKKLFNMNFFINKVLVSTLQLAQIVGGVQLI